MSFFIAVAAGSSFAVTLFLLHRVLRCKHDWQLVDKTEMPSRLEIIRQGRSHEVPYLSGTDLYRIAYRRTVLAMRCSRCGHAVIHKVDSA
jgi:hypothetical protein